jgi:hypothetical protein
MSSSTAYSWMQTRSVLKDSILSTSGKRKSEGWRFTSGSELHLLKVRLTRTYGILMELTHAEIDKLYSEPSVEMYRPEAVRAELADGSIVAALCFNLVTPSPEEANPAYAASLRKLARKLGLPAHYTEMLG